MGGYVPNPLTLSAAKLGGYWLLGVLARRRAVHPRSPLVFAVLRGAAGLLVGTGFLLAMSALAPNATDQSAYALFQVFRVLVWATVLHFWFGLRGGAAALAVWTGAGTLLSVAIDMLFRALAQHDIPVATWTIC